MATPPLGILFFRDGEAGSDYGALMVGPVQEEIAAAFMRANPDVRVTFRAPAPNDEDVARRVLREALANQAPDVAYVGLNRIEILAERQLAQDLAPFMGSAEQMSAAGFTASLRPLGQARGRQYGLAFAADWDGVIALGAAARAAAAAPQASAPQASAPQASARARQDAPASARTTVNLCFKYSC